MSACSGQSGRPERVNLGVLHAASAAWQRASAPRRPIPGPGLTRSSVRVQTTTSCHLAAHIPSKCREDGAASRVRPLRKSCLSLLLPNAATSAESPTPLPPWGGRGPGAGRAPGLAHGGMVGAWASRHPTPHAAALEAVSKQTRYSTLGTLCCSVTGLAGHPHHHPPRSSLLAPCSRVMPEHKVPCSAEKYPGEGGYMDGVGGRGKPRRNRGPTLRTSRQRSP